MEWLKKEQINEAYIPSLAEELNIQPFLAALLCNRGITNFEEARQFFRPSLFHLHDPFLMKDMEKAVIRLVKAIENNEKIMVYGDYDVDGTTAASLMYIFLKRQKAEVFTYIPDRFKEGYGISIQSIDYAVNKGVGLVVALDCGITALDQIEYAHTQGLDYIICDHHLPREQLPNAVAVLNPKRTDCEYPFDGLCGCGVGFKLAQAFCVYSNQDEQAAFDLLDLLAIAIAADIVPMVGENRVMAYYGLQKLREDPKVGLQAMISTLGKPIESISDIVFKIAPRVNAAGRMSTGNLAVELFTSEDIASAKILAAEIEDLNSSRKELDQGITASALEMVQEGQYTTVVAHSDWHKGVVGIVASRLIEHHYRPTIVLCEKDGVLTGSARSVGRYDLHKALSECSHLLENFGGHKMAAGLTLKVENYKAFEAMFEEVVAKSISKSDLTPKSYYDAEIELADINAKALSIIDQMRPFGPQNRAPKFLTKGLKDKGSRFLNGGHIKTYLEQNNKALGGIGFNLGAEVFSSVQNNTVDALYKVEWNEFNNNKTIQMVIEGLRPSGV